MSLLVPINPALHIDYHLDNIPDGSAGFIHNIIYSIASTNSLVPLYMLPDINLGTLKNMKTWVSKKLILNNNLCARTEFWLTQTRFFESPFPTNAPDPQGRIGTLPYS